MITTDDQAEPTGPGAALNTRVAEAVFRQLMGCSEPGDVAGIVQNHPDILSESAAEALRQVAHTHGVAPERVNTLLALVHALRRVEHVQTLEDFIGLGQFGGWTETRNFRTLVQQLEAAGHIAKGTAARVNDTAEDKRARVDAVNALLHGGSLPPWPYEGHELALEPLTLKVLHGLARYQTRLGDPDTATAYWQRLEFMELAAYNRRQWDSAFGNGTDGTVRITYRAMSAGEAELWWMYAGLPSDVGMRALSAVKAGRIGFNEAMRGVQSTAAALVKEEHALKNREQGGPTPPTRSFYLATASAAFCCLCAHGMGTADQIRASAAAFRETFAAPWWNDLKAHERACHAMRYVLFIFVVRPAFADSEETELRWAAEQIDRNLDQLDRLSHPGLTRDLLLARGRLRRELARWEPELLHAALDDFRAGLSVKWAMFDNEARGRGLMDYAGALRAVGANSSTIESLYEEALVLLPAVRYAWTRSAVLLNRAIHRNEIKSGLRAHHQERALEDIASAIAIAEELDAGSPHAREQLASLWLTQGNIIRARSFGDPDGPSARLLVDLGVTSTQADPVVSAAVLAYREGLRVLGDHTHDHLRGLLLLNLGYAYLEDWGNPAANSEAREHFGDAAAQLQGFPVHNAHAQVGRVEAECRSEEPIDAEAARMAVQAARKVLADHADWEGVGKAHLRESEVLLKSGSTKPAILMGACSELQKASSAFVRAGVWQLHHHALRVRADLLVQWASQSRARSSKSRLSEARAHIEELDVSFCSMLREPMPYARRVSFEGRRATLAADLVFLDHLLGRPLGPDLLRQCSELSVAEETSRARVHGWREAMLAEKRLRDEGVGAALHDSVAADVDRLEAALATHARHLSLRSNVKSGEHLTGVLPSNRLILQVVVSTWGSLAVVETAQTTRVVRLGFSRATLGAWLHGDESRIGWITANRRREVDATVWEDEFDILRKELSHAVFTPIDQAGVDFRDKVVHVIPGPLAALPLLACAIGPDSVVDLVRGWAYVSGRDVTTTWQGVTTALLVASDPSNPLHAALPEVTSELMATARLCTDRGITPEVVASRQSAFGADALKPHVAPDGAAVLPKPASIATVAPRLAGKDLIMFSGHGQGSTHLGGRLVLTDEDGKPEYLSLFDALSEAPLGPRTGVVLSACETAWEDFGLSSGMMSISSSFLRHGASWVLGAMWWVVDQQSPVVSKHFVEAALRGVSLDVALVAAVLELRSTGVGVSRWSAYCLWLGVGSGEADSDKASS